MTVTITRTQRRFVLPEADLPTHYVNIAADLPEPLPPPLHPGTREPIGPEMLAPLFPMELIRQEVSADPLIEIPEEVREAYRIYRPTPLHRATGPREGARHAGADLLQERGRLAGRQPQAEHRHRPGVLQPRGGHHPARHRNGRRPVGERARVRRQPLRARDEGLHGEDQLRAEAVSAQLHRVVRGDRHPVSVDRDERRARRARRGSRLHRQPRDRDQRGHRGGGRPRGHEVLARQRPQPRAPAPDGHRPGGDRPDGDGGGDARRRHRLRRWWLELLRHRVPVPARSAAGPIQHAVPGGRAGVVPEPDPGRVPIRLRRHRRHDAAAEDAHPRQRLPAGPDPRRRAALPRHGADGRRTCTSSGSSRHAPTSRTPASRRRSASPEPRA